MARHEHRRNIPDPSRQCVSIPANGYLSDQPSFMNEQALGK
jgi:hypothetical protein